MLKSRLQLTWYNKNEALIPTETGKYGYIWVDLADPRYCETHTLVVDGYFEGAQAPKDDKYSYSVRADLEPQTDNLLINGESATCSKCSPVFLSLPRSMWATLSLSISIRRSIPRRHSSLTKTTLNIHLAHHDAGPSAAPEVPAFR